MLLGALGGSRGHPKDQQAPEEPLGLTETLKQRGTSGGSEAEGRGRAFTASAPLIQADVSMHVERSGCL